MEDKGPPPPRALPVGALFDMTPRLELTLGPKTYSVPPLTFGRWQRLVYAFLGADLVSAVNGARSGEIAVAVRDSLAEAAAAVVPGLSPTEWKEHGKEAAIVALFDFFRDTHHWTFLKAMTGFGAQKEDTPRDATPPGAADLFDSLLVVSRETGDGVADLLETRVEGVLLMMDHTRRKLAAIREAREAAGDESDWVYTPAGESTADSRMPATKDPEEYARISSFLDGARKAYGPREVGDGIEQVWETPGRNDV